MRPRSVDNFLKQARVPYTTFKHPEAFTAQAEAAVSHVPGRSWVKIVVCFADDEPIQAVVPAPFMVDLDRLLLLTGACSIRLATEPEFKKLYPDCEPGAMPPFGTLYLQRVFVDQSLVGESRDGIQRRHPHRCDPDALLRTLPSWRTPWWACSAALASAKAAAAQTNKRTGPEFV